MRRWSKIHGESLAGEICGESLGAEGLGIRQLADIARDTIIILLLVLSTELRFVVVGLFVY